MVVMAVVMAAVVIVVVVVVVVVVVAIPPGVAARHRRGPSPEVVRQPVLVDPGGVLVAPVVGISLREAPNVSPSCPHLASCSEISHALVKWGRVGNSIPSLWS